MRPLIYMVAFLLLTACEAQVPPAFQRMQDGAMLHTQSQIYFPDSINGFMTLPGGAVQYSPHGDNVSVGYNDYGSNAVEMGMVRSYGAPEVAATVYVYPLALHSAAGGVTPPLEQINAETLREISTVHRGSMGNVQTSALNLSMGGMPVSAFYNRFDVAHFGRTGAPAHGEFYLVSYGQWLLKFRFTMAADQSPKTQAFVQAFLNHNGPRR